MAVCGAGCSPIHELTGSPRYAESNSLGRKTEQIDPNCLFCVFYGQQPAMGHTKHLKLIMRECYNVNDTSVKRKGRPRSC